MESSRVNTHGEDGIWGMGKGQRQTDGGKRMGNLDWWIGGRGQRVENATPRKSCVRWLQARRARSDAPHHVGFATNHFDFISDLGVRFPSPAQFVINNLRCSAVNVQ